MASRKYDLVDAEMARILLHELYNFAQKFKDPILADDMLFKKLVIDFVKAIKVVPSLTNKESSKKCKREANR